MDQEQVGNANVAPESENVQQPAEDIFSSEDFFESLDISVNTQSSPSEVQPQDDNEVLQKRYSDSSREAKRLNGKLKEVEPYMPILDAMREDPNLITHVRNYFEGGGQTPATMADKLQLPEDFVFDSDEAFSTPESDSAKVLGATIDGIVNRRLTGALQNQKSENQRLTKESSFRQKHELNDEQWENFVDFAKSKSLELDDIYYLMNRNNRDEKIADNTRQEIQDKMRQVQNNPSTLATAGSTPVESSADDSVFDAILGSEHELEKAFGM